MSEESLIGTVVAEQYRVNALLGEGGMGVVYRARHETLQRDVALKLLRPSIGNIESLKSRFLLEARACSRLDHPGAVVVYDFGEWQGHLYMAMEYLRGDSLAGVIQKEFPFSPEDIVEILVQACEVLHAAHHAGILHRDIKPENLMLLDKGDSRRLLKMVDFGLAFMPDRSGERLTLEGSTIGTPEYMSPEQCMARKVDARTDIYSLGIVLYEMLCKHIPFEGMPTEVIVKHLYGDPKRPEAMNPNVSIHRGLADAAMHCLKKSPEERPQSATAFRDILISALSDASVPLTPPKKTMKKESRRERALAEGLELPMPRETEWPEEEAARSAILVVEQPQRFAESITAALRAKGFSVERVPDLNEALPFTESRTIDALVFDLEGDPENRMNRLADHIAAQKIDKERVILVGPVDSFGPMSRALEMGVADYIPPTAAAHKLPRAIKRVIIRTSSGSM